MNLPVIEIAIASDSNYLVPTTVVLKSLFDNNRDVILSINLIHLTSVTKEDDMRFWESYTIEHGHTFRSIPVDDSLVDVYPEIQLPKSTYLRLLLDSLLPTGINKILYLDADTVVVGNLLDLYKLDLTGHFAAAVKDVINIYAKSDIVLADHLKALKLENTFYFGAGIMLLNIGEIRKHNIAQQYFNFALKHSDLIRYPDQDILNVVMQRKVVPIHPKYNFNFCVERDVVESLWTRDEVEEAINSPIVIHYMGVIKPWSYLSYNPKTNVWWDYLKLTPFRDYTPKDYSLSKMPKKYYLLCTRTLDRCVTLKQKQAIGRLLPTGLKLFLKKGLGR